MTPETISWIGSIVFIGSLVGTLFWGTMSDNIGRKPTCLLSAIPCVISWSMILIAQNYEWLIIARFIIGLTFSGIYLSAPIYVAEIADENIRGNLVSYLTLFFNAGMLFSYIVGAFTSYYTLASLCLSVPLIFLLTFWWFPESPIYLWSKGKTIESEKSLMWFRGGDTVQTMKEITKLKSRPKKNNTVSLKSLVSSRGIIKALFISLTLMVGQILCGSVVIITYAVKILQVSKTPLSPQISAIIVGTLQFCFVFLSSMLVDRAGRKILLIISYASMALSLAVLGGYLFLENESSNSSMIGWIPVGALGIHVVAYAIGLGPVTIVVISEILPQDIKGYSMAKIQMVKALCAFASVKFYPFLIYYLNNYGCFWFFGFWCVLFGVITAIYLPETKCKSLQEILKTLNNHESCSESEDECENILVTKNTNFDSCIENRLKT